jgi:hypothetical protein
MESIIQKIKDSRKITESTLQLYSRNIKRLIKEAKSDDIDIFTSDETFAKLMCQSNNTLANYIATSLVVLGIDKTKNKNRIEELNNRLKDVNKSIKNGTMKKDTEIIKWTTIVELADNYRAKFFKTKQNKQEASESLLLNFYTLYPPQRSEVFSALKVVISKSEPTDTEYNYLWQKNKTSFYIILNKYKTVSKHGKILEQITDKTLIKMIQKFITDFNPVYLFENNKGTLKPPDISRILCKLTKPIGDCLSSSNFRHIYLTERYGTMMTDLKNDTQMMGNTPSVAMSNYISN